MNITERLNQLREEYKWANPTRKASILCLVQALKLKHKLPATVKEVSEEDIKETIF